MPKSAPYQPLLFRLLHGTNALLVVGAWITGFLVYDSYDRRFGGLSLTTGNRSLVDIHGTFGFFAFFVFLAFATYSLILGKQRLLGRNALAQLSRVGHPLWWYTLHRFANTLALLAATLAVVSGKFQDENWLPSGEMQHTWYYVHLLAWIGVGVALGLHLLMSAKVGGLPLLLSVWQTRYRPEESPKLWLGKLRIWFGRLKG